jgi:phosphoglycerate kinase
MNKMTVKDLALGEKRVFLRVDFNVPLKDGHIEDDRRIQESLPTIQHLLQQKAKIIIASHLGRPKGKNVPAMSLKPVSKRLGELTGQETKMAEDCIGDEVKAQALSLKPGESLLLENLRFHPEEQKNDPHFAEELASLAEVYVNDAFGSAHRAHASTEGITKFLNPCLAGFLMEKELTYLGQILENPMHPFVAILGGAKVSDKIDLIENFLDKVDRFLIGGAMAYTFLKAKGVPVGESLTEDDKLDLAKSLLDKCQKKNIPMVLPIDHKVTDESGEKALDADEESIGENFKGADIGPKTISLFVKEIGQAASIVWNGPLGVFEKESFSAGTKSIALAIRDSNGLSVIGGGDTASAINKFGLKEGFDHISTGGGASLEFLSGKTLPGVAALTDKGEQE